MSKYSQYRPRLHLFIQNKLIAAINDPAFNLVLPELRQSTWDRVLLPRSSDDDERERLEFLGDALMHASVALELYKRYPRGSPHLFTVSFVWTIRLILPTITLL
jgi:dsRNA-specific ribonuclease